MTTRTTLARSTARALRLAAILSAAAVALTGALGATGAGADVPPPDGGGPRLGQDERISTKRGTVTFTHHGEIVKAFDKRRDGHGVRAIIVEHGSFEVTDYVADDHAVSMNRSIREGSKVQLRLCYTVDHQIEQCSRPQEAIA